MLRASTILLILVLTLISNVFGQRTYITKRIDEKITLDAYQNESCWKDAEVATNFITNFPEFGNESKFITEVKMVYDNDAIYIAADLHDPVPDSVSFTP